MAPYWMFIPILLLSVSSLFFPNTQQSFSAEHKGAASY